MDRNREYGRNYVSALREAAVEQHVNAFVMNSNYDASVQASQMKIAIAKKVDGIVIWPALYSAEQPILIQVQRAGIPVNISNSQLSESLDLFQAFTGPNGQRIGELQGKELANLLQGKGTYVCIGGTPGNAAAINRQIALERQMANHPGITLLGSQPGNFDKNQAQTAASALISRFGDQIDAVVTPHDIMASGAAQALEAAGLTGKVGLLPHGLEILAEKLGRITETHFAVTDLRTKDCVTGGLDGVLAPNGGRASVPQRQRPTSSCSSHPISPRTSPRRNMASTAAHSAASPRPPPGRRFSRLPPMRPRTEVDPLGRRTVVRRQGRHARPFTRKSAPSEPNAAAKSTTLRALLGRAT